MGSSQLEGGAVLDEVRRLLAGYTDRAEEGRILAILRAASAAELDALLAALPLDELVASLDDRLIGPDNRAALLALLARERLAEISPANRARLLDALQRGPTDRPRELAVRDILLGTRGAELSALKGLVDAGGDYRDLQQLLFHDLDDAALRDEILAHLAREAAALPRAELKVLSDIDDTIYCNWVDRRYPKGTPYPGVFQLYRELDRGAGRIDERLGDLVFITARPGDRAGVVEGRTLTSLARLGAPGGVAMTGALTHLIGNDRIAEKKLENFEALLRLYPEYAFVFFGDSGQGDAIFGAAALAKHREVVRAVFIHDVTGTPEAARAALRGQGIFYFDTYVGAAVEARRLGLIGDKGLSRAARAAVGELAVIAFPEAEARAARMAELERDVAAANAALPAELQIPWPKVDG